MKDHPIKDESAPPLAQVHVGDTYDSIGVIFCDIEKCHIVHNKGQQTLYIERNIDIVIDGASVEFPSNTKNSFIAEFTNGLCKIYSMNRKPVMRCDDLGE